MKKRITALLTAALLFTVSLTAYAKPIIATAPAPGFPPADGIDLDADMNSQLIDETNYIVVSPDKGFPYADAEKQNISKYIETKNNETKWIFRIHRAFAKL